MDRHETLKLLGLLRKLYGRHAFGGDDNAMETVSDWQELFADVPYDACALAAQLFVREDGRGYPPTPAQLFSKLAELGEAETRGEQQAWQLVARAVCNSAYHAGEEFLALPKTCGKLSAHQASLRAGRRSIFTSWKR